MMVTKKEIADYLGVSRTAVSLVLNNAPNHTISAKTRKDILEAAKKLGYRHSQVQPKLCFILYNRESEDPLYMSELNTIENIAKKNGYWLLYINIKLDSEDFHKLPEFLGSQEISGIVLTGDIDDHIIRLVEESSVPYVVFSSYFKENMNIIVSDMEKLAYQATNYLISYGHEKITLYSGNLKTPVHQQTLSGYKKALAEKNIGFDPSYVQVSNEEDGYELASRMELLGIPYTAAICVNTLIQFGAIQYLKDTGKQVPLDISLIGLGYNEIVKMSHPKLTTMFINNEEKEIVVNRLIDLIKHKDKERKIIYLEKGNLFEGDTVTKRKF